MQGTWVRPGGVVVEAGFASALGLRIGDRLSLGGRSFEVVGIAVTAAIPTYYQVCLLGCFLANTLSSYNPGLVWVTEDDVEPLAEVGNEPVVYFLNLKLENSAAASAFVDRYNADTSSTAPSLVSWQSIRTSDASAIAGVQTVLVTGSWLLAFLALASAAVLAGGRMVEQTRRSGLLKAVGGTPWFVTVVLLFEHVLIGLCAAGVALLAGWLLVPLVDEPGASLIGAPSAVSIGASTVGLVVTLALAVAVVATFVPAIRAARQSTVAALADSARVPRRRAWIIRLSSHLPAPLLLGMRLATRRPLHLLLNVFSVAVTAGGLAAVLIVHSTAGNFLAPNVSEAATIVSSMLVALAVVNAVIIAWATALDTRHSAALARALGATPEQITTGLSMAQLLPALVGVSLGIAGGIGLSDVAKRGGPPATVPALWLAVVIVVTLFAIVVFTAIPTRIGARRPIAQALQSEIA